MTCRVAVMVICAHAKDQSQTLVGNDTGYCISFFATAIINFQLVPHINQSLCSLMVYRICHKTTHLNIREKVRAQFFIMMLLKLEG